MIFRFLHKLPVKSKNIYIYFVFQVAKQTKRIREVAKKKSITRNMTLSSRQVTQRLTRKSLTKERRNSEILRIT